MWHFSSGLALFLFNELLISLDSLFLEHKFFILQICLWELSLESELAFGTYLAKKLVLLSIACWWSEIKIFNTTAKNLWPGERQPVVNILVNVLLEIRWLSRLLNQTFSELMFEELLIIAMLPVALTSAISLDPLHENIICTCFFFLFRRSLWSLFFLLHFNLWWFGLLFLLFRFRSFLFKFDRLWFRFLFSFWCLLLFLNL